MRIRHVRLALCLSAVALAGCGSMMFGPTSAQRKQYADQQAGKTATGSAVPTAASSSSSSAERRDYKVGMVDILTAFQKKLQDQPAGFDSEEIVSGTNTSTQLYLVTTGLKLHRYPRQNRVVYILSGRADILLDGSVEEARAGHVIAIPAGATFKLMPIGEQAVRMIVFTTPGTGGSSNVEWLKEVDAPAESSEQEVETVEPIPVPDIMESSSSSEEFQTGTLTTEPDSEVQ